MLSKANYSEAVATLPPTNIAFVGRHLEDQFPLQEPFAMLVGVLWKSNAVDMVHPLKQNLKVLSSPSPPLSGPTPLRRGRLPDRTEGPGAGANAGCGAGERKVHTKSALLGSHMTVGQNQRGQN